MSSKRENGKSLNNGAPFTYQTTNRDFPVSVVATAFSRLDFSPIMRMFSSPTYSAQVSFAGVDIAGVELVAHEGRERRRSASRSPQLHL